MRQQVARSEFATALKAVATQHGLGTEIILEKIKEAIVAAYKRDVREKGGDEDPEMFEYEVELHPVSGEVRIIRISPDSKERKDVTPPGFGRIAAQTAKQVIHQRLREAEKGAIMDEFSSRVGGLVSGMILRFDGSNVRVDLGRTEGLMPSNERVPSERLSSNQRLTFLLKEIIETPRGKQIILSRSDPTFVKALFKREVPEINSDLVKIEAIVRDPGFRTKMAVVSNQKGVDPVGSCVGQKGVRVQAVTNELGGERIDIIPFSTDEKEYVKSALSPVEVLGIKISKKDKKAKVTVAEDQLALAIGREGQNARLASKLTGWDIDILGETKKPAKGK